MKQMINITSLTLVLNCGLLITLSSCSKEENPFILGSELIDSDSRVFYTDTFSVSLSTVWVDSLPTSIIDTFLVGTYFDNVFGRITCSGYWQVGLPDISDFSKIDQFDSITIQMEYSGYVFGDTLQSLTLNIYELLEEIEVGETGYLYNTTKFGCENLPIGSYTFYPRPNHDTILEFTLEDSFGEELFNRLINNHESTQSDEAFLETYPGFVIIPDSAHSASVLGFAQNNSGISLKLYSHRIEEEKEEVINIFPLTNSDYSFTNFSTNFEGSELQYLTEKSVRYPANSLNNKCYIQGGTGLMGRIDFPGFQQFQLMEDVKLLKAVLTIQPAKSSYQNDELPEYIYLYHSNKYNDIEDLLYDASGNYVSSELHLDEEYQENTYYSFDITNFFIEELKDNYFDYQHGIFISFAYEEYMCSLKRLVLNAGTEAATLRLYYLNY